MKTISKLALLIVLSAAVTAPAAAQESATQAKKKTGFTLTEKSAAGLLIVSGIIAGVPVARGDFKELRALQREFNNPTPRNSYVQSDAEVKAKKSIEDGAHKNLKSLKLKVYPALAIGMLGMVTAGALLVKECLARKKS